MFGLIKKVFIELLNDLVNGSYHTKWVSLSNHKYVTQPTLIYSQEFNYFPFKVKLDRCVGSCNTLNDLSNNAFVPNKTKDLNLSVFNIITGTNESKILATLISCECKCKFDEKCNSDQWWYNDKWGYEKRKKRHECVTDCIWNLATYSCENGKYLTSVIGDSVITYDEIIDLYNEEAKSISTTFNEKKSTFKS